MTSNGVPEPEIQAALKQLREIRRRPRQSTSNGVPEPELREGGRKDARRLVARSNAAAAVHSALKQSHSPRSRVLEFNLGLSDSTMEKRP